MKTESPQTRLQTESNEHEQSRLALQESQNRMAGIINSAMDAIISIDVTRCIILFNPAAEKVFGYSATEIMGQSIDRLIPIRFHEAHHHHIENFSTTKTSKRSMGKLGAIYGVRANGEEFPIEASISQVEANNEKIYTVILRDITEKKKMETQFLRAQRMESIGTLASGIAHDLNNILSPVLMAVQLLQARVTDESGQHVLEVLQQNVRRGREMVKQILTFAKGGSDKHLPLHPNQVIKEIIDLLKGTFPKNITTKYWLPAEIHLIKGDPTQVHQVLMNLCINARDAMQTSGGTLTIAAENKTIDEHFARMMPNAKAGQFVVITITDTGTGIPVEVQDKIFDPFFTTKELGKGTGLGLSTVLGIIKSHGGFINVYSEIGKGTKFQLYLPVFETSQPTRTAASPVELPLGHDELILLVDDEAAIREITQGTLENFGYRVLPASNGIEAIALYAQHQGEIQLVLTDMMMPYMDGPAMIRVLQKINPAVQIIVSTGLAEGENAREAATLGVKIFLRKPYNAQELLHTLAQIF